VQAASAQIEKGGHLGAMLEAVHLTMDGLQLKDFPLVFEVVIFIYQRHPPLKA